MLRKTIQVILFLAPSLFLVFLFFTTSKAKSFPSHHLKVFFITTGMLICNFLSLKKEIHPCLTLTPQKRGLFLKSEFLPCSTQCEF